MGGSSERLRWLGDVGGCMDEKTVEELSEKAEQIIEEGECLEPPEEDEELEQDA